MITVVNEDIAETLHREMLMGRIAIKMIIIIIIMTIIVVIDERRTTEMMSLRPCKSTKSTTVASSESNRMEPLSKCSPARQWAWFT